MKKLLYILTALLLISYSNFAFSQISSTLQSKNDWNSRFSTTLKIEDRGLKVEDISNLDKINGFRNAHFNAHLDDFTYLDKTVMLNGYSFEDVSKKH